MQECGPIILSMLEKDKRKNNESYERLAAYPQWHTGDKPAWAPYSATAHVRRGQKP